jgi:hypothetical protein
LNRLLLDGRDWCAAVHESHTEHPSLIYFRSIGTGSGWPAAVGALMDLALIMDCALDAAESRAFAVLLREEGTRMLKKVSALIGLDTPARPIGPAEIDQLLKRLRIAGFTIGESFDPVGFVSRRREHAESIAALAAHLGTPEAPLIPDVTSNGLGS